MTPTTKEPEAVTAVENGTDPKADLKNNDVIDVDADDTQQNKEDKPDGDVVNGEEKVIEEEVVGDDDDDDDEEEYKAEEEDDDDDDDDDDDGEGEDEDGEDDGENAAAKMGLSKEVVARFIPKASLVVRAFHEAAKEGDLDSITKLLGPEAEEKIETDVTDAYEYTALHHAAENGHAQVVKKLIDAGAGLEKETRFFQCRPIHYAAFKGHADVIKTLLDAGAEINSQSEDKRTPLFHACLHDHEECVKVLVDAKADASIKDNEDKTPADVAKSRAISDLLEGPAGKKARTE